MHVAVTLSVRAIDAPAGRWRLGFVMNAGAGVVHTLDDLEAVGAVGDEGWEATRDEWHPAIEGGFAWDARTDAVGGRLRWDTTRYTELVEQTSVQTKANSQVGVEVVRWF